MSPRFRIETPFRETEQGHEAAGIGETGTSFVTACRKSHGSDDQHDNTDDRKKFRGDGRLNLLHSIPPVAIPGISPKERPDA